MKTSHIQRAIKLMWEKHENPDFKVKDIAIGVSFSPWYFNRSFTETVGCPPGQFLSAIRRYKAVQLIQERSHKLPLDQIAYRVGFHSVGTFSSTLKTKIGVTPQTLRTLSAESKISSIPPHREDSITPPIYVLKNNLWTGPMRRYYS